LEELMSFATALAAYCAGIATGPGSETFILRQHPTYASASKTGIVRREPLSDVGEVLSRTVEIFVDKSQVPTVDVDRDLVIVDEIEHVIVRAATSGAGWVLRATR